MFEISVAKRPKSKYVTPLITIRRDLEQRWCMRVYCLYSNNRSLITVILKFIQPNNKYYKGSIRYTYVAAVHTCNLLPNI